jgi:hypothetical protein
MKRLLVALLILVPVIASAQGTGTPSNIRVRIDSNGALTINASSAPTPPYTFPIFSTARLKVDSSGNLVVSCDDCGGDPTVPGGSNTQVQFNDSDAFGGDAGLTYVKATDTLTAGVVNVPTGGAFTYNAVNMIRAQTALNNYYFANGGNLTGSGTGNFGLGLDALKLVTSGTNNTVVGNNAGDSLTTGQTNTCIGRGTCHLQDVATDNVAVGYNAIFDGRNSCGGNVGVGVEALMSCNNGTQNVGVGKSSLRANTGGNQNTAVGRNSGEDIIGGSGNICIGFESCAALTTGIDNTIIGNNTTVSSGLSNNVIIADGDGVVRFQHDNEDLTLGTPQLAVDGAAPTCGTNCGTSPTFTGTDSSFTLTMGAAGSPASGFVITFTNAWDAAPQCVGSMALTGMAVGKLPLTLVTDTTTLTVVTNGTAPANSDKYHFICTLGK